jgi:rhamnosyltransferase
VAILRPVVRVAAVVVTYRPGAHELKGVRALAPQVAHVIVVDNGSGEESRPFFHALVASQVDMLTLEVNLGIGAALNAGIARARALGATHVLLMDQDSVPEADMVARLLEAETTLLAKGVKVGAVGPVYHDPRVGKSWPFYRMSSLGVRGHVGNEEHLVPCDLLISSGTLVRMPVLDDVGGMNAEYFLEHVDTEWSLRTRALGYGLFGASKARMLHTLGDGTASVPLTGRRVQVYQPYRHYYLFRNAVLLGRKPYAFLPWKLHEAQRLLKRLLYFSLMVPPRGKRLRYMLLGLWDGVRGRTGPLQR